MCEMCVRSLEKWPRGRLAEGTPGRVSSYYYVRRSAVLWVILIGGIRESAGQHFSDGDRGGSGMEEVLEG